MIQALEAMCPVETRLSADARLWSVWDAPADAFDVCSAQLAAEGYTREEFYQNDDHCFAAFSQGDCGVFLNYYGACGLLRMVQEHNCRYFAYTDAAAPAIVLPQITQVKLADYGLCEAIRLPDGRFVVIDAGTGYEEDYESLIKTLKNGSPWEKPVIAAWILSHPHSDHFYGYMKFMEHYADEVTIQKYMFNFPEKDDVEHYPALLGKPGKNKPGAADYIDAMYAWMEKTGAPIYTPRTGQRYRIGAAAFEVLSTLEDTIDVSQNINATSLILRMELAGQVVIWATDAGFGYSKLALRYGSYLKADILQIPHHGFQCGDAAGEIAGYEKIRPQICLLPVSEYNAFANFCTFREAPDHLMRMGCVEELITGTVQRTLTLPYTPSADGRRDLERRRHNGQDSAGAKAWIFTGLNTGSPADFNFTLLNITYVATPVRIELYFGEKPQAIRGLYMDMNGAVVKQLCLKSEAVTCKDGRTLADLDIPANAPFAVRFLSEVPIVVSHSTHAPAYHASVNW